MTAPWYRETAFARMATATAGKQHLINSRGSRDDGRGDSEAVARSWVLPRVRPGRLAFSRRGPVNTAKATFFSVCGQHLHRLSKEHVGLSARDLRVLLRSSVHEDRSLALLDSG